MPAIAAHYTFGELVRGQLSPPLSGLLTEQLSYFTLGTQGPDLLFYHKPLTRNEVSALGHGIHREAGEVFFGRALRRNLTGDPAALAYLLGVCCHYALDRACHPYVDRVATHGAEHIELETDFDRFVIEKQRLSSRREEYLPPLSCLGPIAMVYDIPEATATRALSSFRRYTKLLGHYRLIRGAERILGKGGQFSALSLGKPPQCVDELEDLWQLLQGAVDRTVTLLEDYAKAAAEGITCPADMKENFNGQDPRSNRALDFTEERT